MIGGMALQEDYRVTLDAFEGPLDLLLHLIRKTEVDVHDISVAEICDQYLSMLQQLDTVDVEIAGEFLVMAATLVEIKTRTLAPAATEDGQDAGDAPEDESADPRDELIRVLLMYQRFREAGERLEDGRIEFEACRPRIAGRAVRAAIRDDRRAAREEEAEDDAMALGLEDVSMTDLADAFERVMSAVDLTRLGDHVVEVDDTPIALHQADLVDRLERSESGRLTLQGAFEGAKPLQRIGMFMATLELVRERRVDVRQDEIDDPVELILRDEPEPAAEDDDDLETIENAGAEPEAATETPS